ncbi:helix-turn-helix transcriptional regulator [Thalassotalea nanhaiensis]|uniref:Helix-turn-helix transcriptional regulator n=1 Tax=Thalassotalea nanhaiensis TaxID=3065648 RepID=A0ABY9TDQ4_9GAMM|nr:helix-turn-helix transcriptional regulator [Colwelliaceae bacterium SQ345]
MKYIHLVDTQVAMPIVRYLQSINAPVYDLLHQAGLPVEMLEGKHRVIATYPWWKLMQLAYDYSEDEALGFHISDLKGLSSLKNFIEDILPIANNPHDGICLLIHYLDSMSSHGVFKLSHQQKGSWFLAYTKDYLNVGLVPMQQTVFADMLKFVQLFLGKAWQPTLISIQHDDKKKVFNKYFPNAAIADKNKALGFFITKEKLGELSERVKHFIEENSQQSIIPPTFKLTLCQALKPYGKEKLPQLKDVPERVGLSLRKIQRSLAKEGTSFKEVIQQMRFDIAKDLLLNSNDSIIDIATLLGYKNPSNFARAFKIWTGLTPKKYRKLNKK